jgi:outer membrane lipoprotein-sorting protein
MGKPNMNDFNYKILKEETLDGKACWVIEATCKNEDIEDANGFMRQVSWIEKNTFLSHKIEYYDLDNELEKVQYFKDYRIQAGGGYFAFLMKKENVQNGRKSILTINKFQASCSMEESAFSPNMLGK